MSRLKKFIFIISIFLTLSQDNYPILPNPGYDTITIIPGYGTGNKNISQIPQTHMENTISIMTNNSITVNTTNIDPQCTLECYTGCRILFPEYIEQKFCVTNFCKCKIIEKDVNISTNNINQNSSNINTIHSDLNKYGVTQYLDISKKFVVKQNKNNSYLIFYLIILVFSLGYEFIIFKYIEKINDISIFDWLKENSFIKFKKYRITNESEFNAINNGDNNELRQCLI